MQVLAGMWEGLTILCLGTSMWHLEHGYVKVYVMMFVAAFRERLKKEEFECLWTEMVA